MSPPNMYLCTHVQTMSLRNIENGNAFANNILFPILERSCYDGSNKLTFRIAIKVWYSMVIMLKSRVDVLVGAYFFPCFYNLIKSKAAYVILKSIMVCNVMQEWVHKTNSWGGVVFHGEGMFCSQSSRVWVKKQYWAIFLSTRSECIMIKAFQTCNHCLPTWWHEQDAHHKSRL